MTTDEQLARVRELALWTTRMSPDECASLAAVLDRLKECEKALTPTGPRFREGYSAAVEKIATTAFMCLDIRMDAEEGNCEDTVLRLVELIRAKDAAELAKG